MIVATPGLQTIPQQRRAQESLLRVLSAAEALIKSGGFEGMTMAGLAETAGVSIGSIYRYFPDRRTLLVTVQDRFLNRQEERLRQVAEGAQALDAAVGAFVDGIAAGFIENARLYLAFLSSRTDPVILARGQASHRLLQDTFVEACLPFRDEILHSDPEAALIFAHQLMTGLMLVLAEESTVQDAGWKAKWRGMIAELKRSTLLYLKTRPSNDPPVGQGSPSPARRRS